MTLESIPEGANVMIDPSLLGCSLLDREDYL